MGRHVYAAQRVCDGLGQNKIVMVGKNSGPVSSRLRTKFMKFWENVGDHSCFPTPLLDCLCRVSFSRYLPLSLKVVEKPNNVKVFLAPLFSGGTPNYGRLLARITIHRSAKFGRVPFTDLRLQSLAVKWNAEFTEVRRKLTSNLKPFVDESSCRFEMM